MRTAIDAAGREPEREPVDGRPDIQPVSPEVVLHIHGRGSVAPPREKLPLLTSDDVRRTLERRRR